MELNEARCYRALLSRDQRFDGRFFVGVVTTGVYCRPVCRVRPPKRENVRFFACAAAAEHEGFRPCMRCRPEASPGTPAWLGTSAVVSRALRLIAQDALDEEDVAALAARLGLGERQLRRLFATHLGASPAQVARARRVHFARRLLDETDLRVHEIAAAAGFSSLRQFNHAMRATFRRPPTELRKQRGATAAAGEGLIVRLPYRAPFDWAGTLAFLAARAIPGVEAVNPQGYRRTVRIGETLGTIEVRRPRAALHLLLRVRLPGCMQLLEVTERVRHLFDLNADPLPIHSHLLGSAVLAAKVKRTPGARVPGAWDCFETAVRAVLGQQVTVRGATTLVGRLVQRFGTPVKLDDPVLTHLFPSADTLVEAPLEQIGLPRARAHTLRMLARAVASGELCFDAARGLDQAVARLRAVPGIGPWTAQYIAMRVLGEPDAFPSGDLGLRRALGNGAGPLSAARLEAAAEAWRPWRAYAAMYLWKELRT